MPWLGCPFDSPLAPRKGGRAAGHRQVSDVGRHHGHFPFHPALLLPTTHPAPIQSDQHRMLSGLDGFGPLVSRGADALRLRLLLRRLLLAMPVGQETDLFGTDLRETP